jgi:hypothetical protein
MIRITLIELALVATPFLLFFLYRAMVSARRTESGEALDETPYQLLFLSGSAVALAALVAVVLLGRDQVFVPPSVVDGEVVPGYFISREDAIAQGLIARTLRDPDAGPDAAPDAGPDAPIGDGEETGAERPDARAP